MIIRIFSYKENRFVECEKVPCDTSKLVNHRPCSFSWQYALKIMSSMDVTQRPNISSFTVRKRPFPCLRVYIDLGDRVDSWLLPALKHKWLRCLRILFLSVFYHLSFYSAGGALEKKLSAYRDAISLNQIKKLVVINVTEDA